MKHIVGKLLKLKRPALICLFNCLGALCFAILLVGLCSLYQHFKTTQDFRAAQDEALVQFEKERERIFERLYGLLHLTADRIIHLPKRDSKGISDVLISSQRLALRHSSFSFENFFYISADPNKQMFSRFGLLPDPFKGSLESVVSSKSGLHIIQSEKHLTLQKVVIGPNEMLIGVVQLALSLSKLKESLSISPKHFQVTGINIVNEEDQQHEVSGEQSSTPPTEDFSFQKSNANPLASQIQILITKHHPQSYVDFLVSHREWFQVFILISFLLSLCALVVWRVFLSRELKTLRQKNNIFAEQTQQLYCKLTEANRSRERSKEQVESWKTTLNARQNFWGTLQDHDKERAKLIQKSLSMMLEDNMGKRNFNADEYNQLLNISLSGTQNILSGTVGPEQVSSCNLMDLFEECRALFSGNICENDLVFEYECDESMTFEGDALAFKALVISMVHMATLRTKDKGNIMVIVTDKYGNLEFTIKDDGYVLRDEAHQALEGNKACFLDKKQMIALSEKLGGQCDFNKAKSHHNLIELSVPQQPRVDDDKVVHLYR